MDYIITKDYILKAIVVKYDYIENGVLVPKKEPMELKLVEQKDNKGNITKIVVLYEEHEGAREPLRYVLFCNHKFIDLETGEELFQLNNSSGYVEGPIYQNQYYILELLKFEVSDEMLEYASQVYENFLEKEKLYKDKKILKFPKTRIY